jgi:hypothetical protein
MLSRSGLLRNAFSSNRPSWSAFRRQYHQQRIVMVAPYPPRIVDLAGAFQAIDDIYDFLQKAGLLAERVGCLTVVTVPEFWANGHLVPGPAGDDGAIAWLQEQAHNAGHPLPMPLFKAMVDRSRERFGALPPGVLVVFGGVAVDTGTKLSDGTVVGANLGWIVESAQPGDVVLLNKAKPHAVDGWDLTVFTAGQHTEGEVGPYTFTITDPKTGEQHVYTVYCCFDMIAAVHPAAPAQPRTVLANNGGTPPSWQLEWKQQDVVRVRDTVAVNESMAAVRSGKKDGVFDVAQVPVHPWLSAAHAHAPAGLSTVLLWFAEHVLGVTPTEALGTTLGFQRVGTTVMRDVLISAIVTEPRDLPKLESQPVTTGAKPE